MRHPPTRSWRAIIALILLQVSLAGPWASHVGAAAAGPAAVHVEAAGDARCPVVHDEDRCLACQAIGQRIGERDAKLDEVQEIRAGGGIDVRRVALST